MDLQGTVKKVTDLQTFNSGFQKREMILMTEEQYPQPISIEFLQDKAELASQFSEGDRVKVGINIRGREWTSPDNVVKYFNSIVGWRVEKVEGNAVSTEPTSAAPISKSTPSAANATDVFAEDEDDLPF
jgi:single-strand DNA-binding protein